jgi:hypothetical protein
MVAKIILVGKLGLATAAVAVVAGLSFYLTRDPFLAACEDAMKDRLRSPSTYNRLSVSDMRRRPATLLEYMEVESPAALAAKAQMLASDEFLLGIFQRKQQDFEKAGMDILSIEVEHEAANGFGTPIRGWFVCSVFRNPGEPLGDTAAPLVMINGQTNLGWSIDRLNEADG